MKFFALLCVALMTAPAGTLLAQDTTGTHTLAPHSRVRLFAPTIEDNQRIIGTVEHSDSTALQIRAANGMLWTIPRGSIYSVEVSRGQMSAAHAIVRGAAGGILLGAIGGALWGSVSTKRHRALPYGETGAAIGAVLGATFGRAFVHERWEKLHGVPMVAVRPSTRGTNISLAIARSF
ncbi:MAG TPA: hypothetical protein VFS44_13875 [Gemmatimonadaceae bacterium]|nr:hypothetical protein [Gemmatimonadaceae bacterium]